MAPHASRRSRPPPKKKIPGKKKKKNGGGLGTAVVTVQQHGRGGPSSPRSLRSFGCDEVVDRHWQDRPLSASFHGRPGGAMVRRSACAPHGRPADHRDHRPALGLRRTPGKMHACGHDGHTAMLLAPPAIFAATRNFTGSVAVNLPSLRKKAAGGGREMVNDGMMERYSASPRCSACTICRASGWPVSPSARGRSWRRPTSSTSPSRVSAAMPRCRIWTIDPIGRRLGHRLVAPDESLRAMPIPLESSVVVSVTKFLGGSAYKHHPRDR